MESNALLIHHYQEKLEIESLQIYAIPLSLSGHALLNEVIGNWMDRLWDGPRHGDDKGRWTYLFVFKVSDI